MPTNINRDEFCKIMNDLIIRGYVVLVPSGNEIGFKITSEGVKYLQGQRHN